MFPRLLLALSVVACSGLELLQDDYQLVWSDEFNGNAIDRSKWDFEQNCWGGGNLEKQCYIDDTSVLNVSGGVMRIQPRYHPQGFQGSAEGCTNNNENSCTWTQPATSARIRTINTASFLYGRFEIRARMPEGNFLWPAFWMLPTDDVYGTWAASGEIDILEYRGQRPTYMEHTLHFGGMWPDNVFEGSGPLDIGINYRDQFATLTCEWDPDEIRWYINGQIQRTATLVRSFYSGSGPNPYTDVRQPFDKRFHMIINVAVSGVGFFPPATYGDFNAQVDAQTWTTPMEVDYVRVYQRGGVDGAPGGGGGVQPPAPTAVDGPPTCLGGPGVPGWSANATCCEGRLCAINQGQCSANSQCFGALVCGAAGSCASAWGSNAAWNDWRCCQQPPNNPPTCLGPPDTPGWYADEACCNTRLCSVYEGQCQSDNQCAGSLVCGAPGTCAAAWGTSEYADWKCCVTPPAL